MIQHYYRSVNAVVFVYDVNSQPSFEALSLWIAECEKYNLTATVPRIIIGNKVDTGNQIVNTNVAQKFADAHNMPVKKIIIISINI
jgi:GTPase SAR1 family protein